MWGGGENMGKMLIYPESISKKMQERHTAVFASEKEGKLKGGVF